MSHWSFVIRLKFYRNLQPLIVPILGEVVGFRCGDNKLILPTVDLNSRCAPPSKRVPRGPLFFWLKHVFMTPQSLGAFFIGGFDGSGWVRVFYINSRNFSNRARGSSSTRSVPWLARVRGVTMLAVTRLLWLDSARALRIVAVVRIARLARCARWLWLGSRAQQEVQLAGLMIILFAAEGNSRYFTYLCVTAIWMYGKLSL